MGSRCVLIQSAKNYLDVLDNILSEAKFLWLTTETQTQPEAKFKEGQEYILTAVLEPNQTEAEFGILVPKAKYCYILKAIYEGKMHELTDHMFLMTESLEPEVGSEALSFYDVADRLILLPDSQYLRTWAVFVAPSCQP